MDITQLQAELEAIIAWFESDDMTIDDAAKQYEKGLKIAATLQERLQLTENEINKLKQSFAEVE